VTGDPANLRQVFQNLIGNAIKFSEAEPHVAVQAESSNGIVRFAVADNGIGMDAKDAREIFQPFHRLHGGSHYPGTGIGLAVCERIVEHHGGRIWAESEPGRGSTFKFELPASEIIHERPAPRGEASVA
jgi:signal transduction histidine kinase